MGGNRRQRRRSRIAAAAAAGVAAALSLGVAACGGGSSSNASEASGAYPVKIVTAEFPPRQRLGETTLLRLGVHNDGRETLPSLTVTITGGGEEADSSELPFGYRSGEPGLAQPDRPIWVLSARYPKVNGSAEPAGAETPSAKTFAFGPLKRGETTEAVWKLNAVRTGSFTLFYEVGAGLGGKAKAETAAGTAAGGSFRVTIAEAPPDTVVTDSGEVVPAPAQPTQANR